MKKIVFFSIPAHGHVNPTLAVAAELCARGNKVWYYGYKPQREKIEKTGAVFVPCDDFDAEMKLSPEDGARLAKDLAFSTEVLCRTTIALGEKVMRDMKKIKPDVIVADSMAVWGKLIARRLGVPFVSSTTTFAFNKHSAKILKQSAGDMVKMLLSLPRIHKQIKALQEAGYPIKNVLDIIGNDENTDTIVYTTRSFQPCAETFPEEKYAFVGPLVRQIETPIQKTREKLIYISMGTVNNDFSEFYQKCVSAFTHLRYQVILSIGERAEMPKNLPANIEAYREVDQMAVLEQADVFFTHCGMNSVNESLYSGVPMVLYPQTPEESGVAARVAALGAGLRFSKGDDIRMAVETLLLTRDYRRSAEKLAADFQSASGAGGAADKIIMATGRKDKKS